MPSGLAGRYYIDWLYSNNQQIGSSWQDPSEKLPFCSARMLAGLSPVCRRGTPKLRKLVPNVYGITNFS